MGYVAVKGGTQAIENAKDLLEYLRVNNAHEPIEVEQIESQFRGAVDKIMGEGSLYSTEYAAIALKQSEGCVLEGAFVLRAFRATLSRKYYSSTINTEKMFVQRRISSSFREIPGGQILGATRDYIQRTLNTAVVAEDKEYFQNFKKEFEDQLESEKLEEIHTYSKVIDILKDQGLVKPVPYDQDQKIMDVTRVAIKFPAPRSARLQMLARAETGGIMALGYSSMRGHGSVHPTVGELRVGLVDVHVKDSEQRERYIGKIKVTEAEMISKGGKGAKAKKGVPFYSVGYGLCFGQNETKAICMGILDRAMRDGNHHAPAHDQEFVLYHTDGIESMGFTNHLKLPHYVTFQSGLKNLRDAMKRADNNKVEEEKAKPEVSIETV